jgi:hypothetical protein
MELVLETALKLMMRGGHRAEAAAVAAVALDCATWRSRLQLQRLRPLLLLLPVM